MLQGDSNKHVFLSIEVNSSLSVGHYDLCRDDIGDLLLRNLRKPRSSLNKEKTPMRLASGFCLPEPLPVHTGIKGDRCIH